MFSFINFYMCNSSLLFFTAVNSKYHQFVLPFIYFAAQFNKNSKFEIVFVDDIPNNIKDGINYLKDNLLISDILLRKINTHILPQKIRFLETPKLNAEYTYISDIDILNCEDILNFHKNKLFDNCYHNIARTYSSATSSFMSGLHFCKTNDWFKRTEQIRLKFKNNDISKNDENMLFLITKQSNIFIDEEIGKNMTSFIKNRPVHGIHLSLNRKPFSPNAHISNVLPENFKFDFLLNINSDIFKNLINKFDVEFKITLEQFLDFCKLNKTIFI